jgi:hypothetical protein
MGATYNNPNSCWGPLHSSQIKYTTIEGYKSIWGENNIKHSRDPQVFFPYLLVCLSWSVNSWEVINI